LITGAAIIYATDEVLDKHLRQVRAEQSQLEDEVLPRFASEVGLSWDSAAFARFRKLSRGWKADRLTPEELLDIRSLSRNLSQLDDEELIKWATRLQEQLKEISGPKAQTRNRVAFVSTIIRPLSTKWLSRWQAEGRDDISIDDAFEKARELLQFELDGKSDLAVFFEQVYSYFEQVVVFSGDLKPSGTVAESSKRAYSAAWANFTAEAQDEVWSLAERYSQSQLERMIETVVGSVDQSELFAPRERRASTPQVDIQYEQALSPRMQAPPREPDFDDVDLNQDAPSAPPLNRPAIRIGVSSVSATELVAHKDWRTLSDLKAGLLNWLSSLRDVWGEDANTLSGKVESVSGESVLASIALPPSDASTFAERAIRVANF